MSPVFHAVSSTPASAFPRRSRHASPSSQSLFPDCSEHSPNARTAGLAPPAISPGGESCAGASADCPPQNLAGRSMHSAQSPEGNSATSLVGIARLAASAPAAETKRTSREKPEYFVLPVRSILNRCDSDRVPFEWTINPYRGCEFGCKYCYARYTHEYMEIDGREFERRIFVKQDAPAVLPQELYRKYSFQSAASGGTKPDHIAIGTATDPYQPAEKEYGVTRACLEELAKHDGLSISIITKSNQIVRDIDVLKRIAQRSSLYLNITVTTLRARLARLLEPRAPRPDLRLSAISQLRDAGLDVGVSASPLLPGITDGEGELESVAAATRTAGAQWFFSGVLFLMPSSSRIFLPFLREKFPRLARQYDQWYSHNGYAPEDYRKKISDRVKRIRNEYGFHSRPWEANRHPAPCSQLSLNLESNGGAFWEPAHSCSAG